MKRAPVRSKRTSKEDRRVQYLRVLRARMHRLKSMAYYCEPENAIKYCESMIRGTQQRIMQ